MIISFSVKYSRVFDIKGSSQHYHELGKKTEAYLWTHVKSSEGKA